jgi:uncharacterized protein (DUF1697 family)
VTRYAAFLRGINLGNRTVKNTDLAAVFERLGFSGVKTLLASGNVMFDADEAPQALRPAIEAALEQRFGFDVGTVLRSQDDLRAMVAADPFAGKTENADLKLYVTLLATPEADRLPLPCGIPGDFEVVKCTKAEIFHEAYRMPTGRYGAGSSLIGKGLGKSVLWTNRNWNTIVKAVDA